MAKSKISADELEQLVQFYGANPTSLCQVGRTYTFLGVPPAWVRGRVIAENIVCVVLAPGATRLGDVPEGEHQYEDIAGTRGPVFLAPLIILKSSQIEIIDHGVL